MYPALIEFRLQKIYNRIIGMA